MTDEKEFMTLEEASAYTGIKRATIYNYLNDLGIEPKKFGRSRRKYLPLADVKQLKEYKESPWKFKVDTRKPRGRKDTAKVESKDAA
jgi:excisionase family DNA binding protein